MELIRMSAAGNAFYVALEPLPPGFDMARFARKICAGRGLEPLSGQAPLPSDGLILGHRNPPGQIMLNPDGSQGLCANGLRCLARLLADEGVLGPTGSIESSDGPKTVRIQDDGVETGLGRVRDLPGRPGSVREAFTLRVGSEELSGFGVYLGNPHFVVFTDTTTQARVRELGPALENHAEFPAGVNAEFAVESAGEISVRVWERGAGETLSCGTGAVAVAAAGPAGIRPGEERRIRYPGGTLTVSMGAAGDLLLSGAVHEEGRYRCDVLDLAETGGDAT